ncbi:hypothetical protein TRFO_08469 [Tritrichomonas foetus]|uniref:Uncharacterized protein n=1 Tax=Tritrichomonas foetus TaxID=1144522 RepID=A0A1J4JKQ7_9EUKA|nr:hypothetical protein TRFO_08469 [Tritrichomonas foetus]|eukprot:OHS99225.1 hypothetical protein TRFO_08469 [Tritrichomonas foetus]
MTITKFHQILNLSFFVFIGLVFCDANPYRASFTWKHFDIMTDRFYVQIPEFNSWQSECDSINFTNFTDTATISPKCNIYINLTVELQNNVTLSELNFGCFTTNNETIPSTSECTLVSNNDSQLQIKINQTINYTLPEPDSKTFSCSIVISNNEDYEIGVLLPELSLFRYETVTNNAIIQQEALQNHTKAMHFTITLSPDMGRIELETTRIRNAHRFPNRLSPNRLLMNSQTEIALLPIIASESRIIGFNLFDDAELTAWKIKEYPDLKEMSLMITLEPKKTLSISYILIETSSSDYYDALEIWQQTFADIYWVHNSGSGAIAMPTSGNIYCMTDFDQKFMWGNKTYTGFPQVQFYYPTQITFITIPISPSNLPGCANSSEDLTQQKLCNYVLYNGIKTQSDRYIYEYDAVTKYFTYEIVWSSNFSQDVEDYRKSFNSSSFVGFGHEFRPNIYANYRLYENSPYYLVQDFSKFLPSLSSIYSFMKFNENISPNGNIYIGSVFHPQFVASTAAYGIPITSIYQVTALRSFYLNQSTYDDIFNARMLLGSRPVTLLEISQPSSIIEFVEDYLSLALGAGTYPSFYYPLWGLLQTSCILVQGLIDRFTEYSEITTVLLDQTIFYPNNRQLLIFRFNESLQNPPNDGNSSYYEASTFCKHEDTNENGLIDCYTSIMLFGNLSIVNETSVYRILTVSFTSEEIPNCIFAARGVNCSVVNQTVTISINEPVNTKIFQTARTAVIHFKYRVEQTVADFIRENLAAIIGSLFGVLFLFVCMGFGIWFMFCRRRSNDVDLARIMNTERDRRKEKQKRLREIEKQESEVEILP